MNLGVHHDNHFLSGLTVGPCRRVPGAAASFLQDGSVGLFVFPAFS